MNATTYITKLILVAVIIMVFSKQSFSTAPYENDPIFNEHTSANENQDDDSENEFNSIEDDFHVNRLNRNYLINLLLKHYSTTSRTKKFNPIDTQQGYSIDFNINAYKSKVKKS